MNLRVSMIGLLASSFLASCGGGGGAAAVPDPDDPPSVVVTAPADDLEVPLGAVTTVEVVYADDDPDSVAATDLLADGDGDLATTSDQVVIATSRPDQDGAVQSVLWNLAAVPAGTYKVYARTYDATTTVVAGAPATLIVNAPPTSAFLNLAADVTVSRGASVEVRYADNDVDDAALTWLFADRDGTLDTPADTEVIAEVRSELGGAPQSVAWDTRGIPFGSYRILSVTWDGSNAAVVRAATGRVHVDNASFAASAGGLASEFATSVAARSDGSCVVVGFHAGTAVFGRGEANETSLALGGGLEDAFVAAYTSYGTLAWAKRITGTGYEEANRVVALSDGSVVVTGWFTGVATFGEGETNVRTLTAGGTYDLFLAKFNANGTLAWAKQAGGAGAAATGIGIAAFSDGSVVVTGSYAGPAVFGSGEGGQTTLTANLGLDVFVARFNANGTLAWAKRATSAGNEEGHAVATFADGTCLVTGWFDGAVTFGPGEAGATTLTPFGVQEVFVARYNGSGTLAWATQAGGSAGTAAGEDVATFADGTCVVAGWFTSYMDFGFGEPDETNFLSLGERDAFVARFRANGTLAWAVQQGGAGFDATHGVEGLADGSCLITGYFDGAAWFGIGDPEETILYSTSLRDLTVGRLEADGSLRWIRNDGGTSTQVVPLGATLFPDGSFGVAGIFDDGGVLFGAGGNRPWSVVSEGLEDAFVARYNADGTF